MRFLTCLVVAAGIYPLFAPEEQPRKQIRFAFWNVENLFDTADDPKNNGDDEFLPKNGWSGERYKLKLAHLAEVIGQIDAELMGLVEVENRKVLEDLVATPALAARGYRVVHVEGGDARGIDVAIIFRAPLIPADASQVARLHPVARGTRGILEVRLLSGHQIVTVLVNHWPSRRGKGDTAAERKESAQALRKLVLERQEEAAKSGDEAELLILGDFNDDPFDSSIEEVLGAVRSRNAVINKREGFLLYNPMWKFYAQADVGTHYFNPQWKWHIFDQCIVTRGLLDERGLALIEDSLEIFAPDATRDQHRRPLRFARKPGDEDSWTEGYSDHFPIRGILEVIPKK